MTPEQISIQVAIAQRNDAMNAAHAWQVEATALRLRVEALEKELAEAKKDSAQAEGGDPAA